MFGDLLIDVLLVTGFGVQHSVLATVAFKARLTRRTGITALLWRAFQSLFNVVYVLLAILVWQPVGTQVWEATGVMGAAVGILCLLGWLWYFQLHIFEYDAGMAFGSSAAISAVEGQRAPTLELWKVGTRRWIRFPVHTAFFPMFLAFPAMTLSTLAFGISANIYNVVGTILYDKRLERMGKPYTTYQTLTGNFLPRPGVLSGAADLDLPKRRHWREPAQYLAAFLIGLAGGVAYYFAMGVPGLEVSSVVLAAAMALVVAVCGGGLLSVVPRGRWHIAGAGLSWGNLLACLGTAMAIVSAVSLMAWFGLAFLATGGIPFLGLVLPMWIIVLWIGHVCLYFGGYRREWQPAGDPLPATGV